MKRWLEEVEGGTINERTLDEILSTLAGVVERTEKGTPSQVL
ncbi:hypothetical protein [Sulfodiicoccus acidiphilus]|nr:hypothetical protein [Sulfodiicoccus acidiphilus]